MEEYNWKKLDERNVVIKEDWSDPGKHSKSELFGG